MTEQKRIYLDYAANTPLAEEAGAAMAAYEKTIARNPASVHANGIAAADSLHDARERIARIMGCRSDEIIFTSGGTESDNLALKGYALANREKGQHIIVSAAEHAAVLESAAFLESCGFCVTYLPLDENGLLTPEALQNAMRSDTILVCVMHVNNETGVMQDIDALVKVAHAGNAAFFSDGVAAVGHFSIDISALGVDMYAGAAHKFGGPCGTGFLYCKQGIVVHPLLHGGGQEGGLRGGTESVALCIGMAAALDASVNQPDSIRQLRDRMEDKLLMLPDSAANGREAPRADYIGSVSFGGCSGESIAALADIRGVSLSAGAACHSGALAPSHVLLAMGKEEAMARGTIRFSLSAETTETEIDRAVAVISDVVEKIRAV